MTAIEFENVGKQYRLGLVSTQTLSHDLNRWWQMNVLHKEDPYLRIGETNDRSVKGSSDYVWALKDINFKVEQGDVVGIIGRNGAGKSTLLKLLSKVTGPSTGVIRARGRIGSLLEVGTGFHPEMTGRENIYMNGAILGMMKSEINKKLDEIVDFSGCERYLDTPVKRYSSGMMVRLGFAVAAHLDPEILVVDEVLAVGDAEFQKKAIGKMKDVSQGEGRTVLFVSHNMAAVRNLCKNGIVLKDGMVSYSGSVLQCVEYYLQGGSVEAIQKHVDITDKHRLTKDILLFDFIIESADLLNEDPENISTDEMLKFLVNIKRINLKRNAFQFHIQFFDVRENVVSFYRSDLIYSPDGRERFSIKVNIPKHSLVKGRYFVKMEVVLSDFQSCLPFDSCYNTLSFVVTQVSKQGPLFYQDWYPEWGLTVHNQNEFEVMIED